jgi:hypothetical protein
LGICGFILKEDLSGLIRRYGKGKEERQAVQALPVYCELGWDAWGKDYSHKEDLCSTVCIPKSPQTFCWP